jgi:hypothetical protein
MNSLKQTTEQNEMKQGVVILEGVAGRSGSKVKMTFSSFCQNGRICFDITTREIEGGGFWDARFNRTFDSANQMSARIKRELGKGALIKFSSIDGFQ